MTKPLATLVALILAAGLAGSAEEAKTAGGYKALKHAPPAPTGTWAILDRDGANRPVDRYLSSLGAGESGTGTIVSPLFRVAGDVVRFTICGHDGQGGGAKKNFIALADVRKGNILRQAFAPGADPMQEQSWNVADLKDREVRIEVHDGDSGGAFAWMGIGRIDAGPALRIDFAKGMPEGWTATVLPQAAPRAEVVRGGVPFLRYPAQHTMLPASGVLELSCGFAAKRLLVLGCTVPAGKPLETYGTIEVVYRNGPSDRFPLLFGFTLDQSGKLLSPSKAVYLRASADPFQHYLALGPRAEVIEKIVVRRNPQQDAAPRITAITCQTDAVSENLLPLPAGGPDTQEAAWIEAHTITAKSPDPEAIRAEIRRAHKLLQAGQEGDPPD